VIVRRDGKKFLIAPVHDPKTGPAGNKEAIMKEMAQTKLKSMSPQKIKRILEAQ
jgi:hypothetical protein